MKYANFRFDLTQFAGRSRSHTLSLVAYFLVACLLFLTSVSTAVSQDLQATKESVNRKDVLDAIDGLHSRSFRVRQDTEELLWRMGPAIEPFLAEVLKYSDDLEIHDRIESLRFKFELGLTPDMPASKRNWILTAINGSGQKERREATANLAGAGEYAAVVVVLDRVTSETELRDYYAAIMAATRTIESSDKLDDFQFGLLRRAMGLDARNAATMTRTVLRDAAVRKRSTTTEWIQRLVTLIDESPTNATRRSLVDSMYFDSSTIEKIAKGDLLHEWINAVAKESDRNIRLRHVAKVLSSSTLVNAFVSTGISIDISKLYKNLTPAGRNALVDSASQVPKALAAMHRELGDEQLLKAIDGCADLQTRNNLLGRIAALESWPKDTENSQDVLGMIERESGVSRQQIVIGYLEGLGKREIEGGAAPQEVAEALWQLLNSEDEQGWQLVALLETYMSPRTFGDRQNNDTIDRMIRLTPLADAKAASLYAYGPLSRRHFGKELAKHKRSLDFLRSMSNLPDSTSISARYRSLLNSSSFTSAFKTKQDRVDLLEICRDEMGNTARYYAASGILSNKTLLKNLLSEGQYSFVEECLIDSQDRSRLASVMATFMVNQSTINYLIKQKRIDEVLDFQKGKTFSESEKYLVLYRYVSSDSLITGLFEADQYEPLVEMIDNIKSESQRKQLQSQLTHRKVFARLVIKQGKLKPRLQKLFADKTWISRRGYNNLISNLSPDAIKAEPKAAEIFWELAAALPREYDRRECIRALLSSRWFLIQLQEQGQLDAVVKALPKLVDPKYYFTMLQSTFRSEQVVHLFDNGQLNTLLGLAASLDLDQQQKLFQNLGYSSHIKKWFAGDDQPDRLLKSIKSIDDKTMQSRFAAALFSSAILGGHKGKDLSPKMMKFVKDLPEQAAVEVSLAMLSQYHSEKIVTQTDLKDLVLSQLDRDDLEPRLLTQMASSTYGSRLLKDNGKARRLINLIRAIKDPKEQLAAKHALVNNTYMLRELTDDELLAIYREWRSSKDLLQLVFALSKSSTLIGRLAALGQTDSMIEMIHAKSNSSSSQVSSSRFISAQWAFYTQPEVIKLLKARNQSADPLVELMKLTSSNYLQSRSHQLLNSTAAVAWLLDTKGWTPFQEFVDRTSPTNRRRMIESMSNNSSFAKLVRDHGHWEDLMKLVGDNESWKKKLSKFVKENK